MKVLAATLAVLLLVATCSLAEADPRNFRIDALSLNEGTACCFSYISRPIPRRFITSAYRTSERCLQPAVVFVTKRGRELCANPELDWVQKYLNDLNILEY